VSDPVRQALADRRAKKRRRARPVEEQAERPAAPLVSQGVRSSLPRRARPGPDELIRAAVFELRGRASRIRL
jgi:hypothetical protein